MAKSKRWVVVLDHEVVEECASRAAARTAARWHNRHPANRNIRLFGPYKNAEGVARVVDRWAAPDYATEGES